MKLHATTITTQGGIDRCINLRQASTADAYRVGTLPLVPVGIPTSIPSARGWAPFHSVSDEDGIETLYFINGSRCRIISSTESYPLLAELELGSEPLCAINTPEGVTMMLEGGKTCIIEHTPNNEWAVRTIPAPLSPLTLTAKDEAEIAATGGYRYLSGDYGRFSMSLNGSDTRTLADELAGCYLRLDSLSRDAGQFLQPVVGYYRLLDAKGREIYRGAPTVLGPTGGLNCLTSTTVAISSEMLMGLFDINCTPYSIVLRLNCDPADPVAMALLKAAATVEVCLSPQLHPVSLTAQPHTRLTQNHDGGWQLSFLMPGTSTGLAVNPQSQVQNVLAILSHLDSACTASARISVTGNIFAGVGSTVTVIRNAAMDARGEMSRMKAIAAMHVPSDGRDSAKATILEQCAIPHTFSARVGHTAGSTVVWADITPRLFNGFTPSELARDAEAGVGTAVATVDIPSAQGGSQRVVATQSGVMARPTSLSPLLCYPLRSASRITVATDAHTFSVPLMTVPGCQYAFWLNPDLRPVDIAVAGNPASLTAIPAEKRDEVRYPGAVLTADIGNPLAAKDCTVATSHGISHILPTIRTATGWNFAYSRFYLLGEAGIYTVAVDSSFRVGAPVLLHGGGCRRGDMPFVCPDGTMCCVSGDSLLVFSGGKPRVAVSGVSAAGYCARHDEVWVTVEDAIRVYDSKLAGYYTRTLTKPAAIATVGTHLIIIDDDGSVSDASREVATDSVYIGWSGRVSTGLTNTGRRLLPPRVRMASMSMAGKRVVGCVTIVGDNGADMPKPIVAFTINGAIDAPITARLVSPRRSYVTCLVTATVTPDFILDSFTIE